MGAISAGLGLGTTVYFELPLFSSAMAGKMPLAPITTIVAATSQPLPSSTKPNNSSRSSSSNNEDVVAATPQRMKPRPLSPPLTGSAVHIHDVSDIAGDGDGEIIHNASPLLRRKTVPGVTSCLSTASYFADNF